MTATIAELLFRYLQLNVLIAVAFVLFFAVRRLVARFDLPVGAESVVRLGRTLLAVTLLAFLAAQLLSLAPMPTQTDAAQGRGTAAALLEQLGGAARLVAQRLPLSSLDGPSSWLTRLDPWTVQLLLALALMFVMSGLALGAKRTGLQLRSLHRLVRGSVPLRRHGRLRIVVSDAASVPFSTAVFGSAHVVLPVGLLHEPDLLRVALRHELQHHRRRDPQWAVGLELLRFALFWNPAAHGWVRHFVELHELACDEALVRRGVTVREYGHCLLRVAELAVARRIVASTAMATTSDRGGQLQRRIDMLFRHDRDTDSRRWPFGLGAASVLALLAVSYVAAVSWPTAADVPALDPEAGAPAEIKVLTTDDAVTLYTQSADGGCAGAVPEDCRDVIAQTPQAIAPSLEFETASGALVDLAELRGKVVLVDFWAEWCRPCVEEVERLKLIDREFGGADFEIVGVSLSRSEELFRKFVREHDIPWPQRYEDDGWQGEAARAFGAKAVPSHYLVDRDGRITHVPLGNPQRLAQTIESMINSY